MKRRGWVRLVSGLALLAFLAAWSPPIRGAEQHPAPDFSARDMDGKLVRLSDFAGKKHVYLWFWASW
ncbi:MAG: peroxiredoxin family protein [Candidatus Methylomirabilia bacterium]